MTPFLKAVLFHSKGDGFVNCFFKYVNKVGIVSIISYRSAGIAGTLLMAILTLLLNAMPVSAFSVENNIITDNLGRKINVEKPFKRIISLYGAHTENIFFIGAAKSLIGVTKNEVFPKAAKEKTVFSYHDDPEKFLAYKPDLVLIRPMIDRGYTNLMKRLEKSGITVVSVQPASIAEMFEYWKVLGLLTGKTDNAGIMINRFKTNVEKFRMLSGSVTNRKKVYFEAIHSRMKTFTPDSMAIFVLETAGGINVASDASQVRNTNIAIYGKEQILSKADEIDVFLAQTGVMNRPDLYMIKNEPGFKLIKAVKNNQIFFIDEMIVSRPTYRLLNGISVTGSILYPEVFNGKGKEILTIN